MSSRDESKLPKWAQELLASERAEVARLRVEVAGLRAAHAVLCGRNWRTVPGPKGDGQGGKWRRPYRRLYVLNHDDPIQVATIGEGDILLIGRSDR